MPREGTQPDDLGRGAGSGGRHSPHFAFAPFGNEHAHPRIGAAAQQHQRDGQRMRDLMPAMMVEEKADVHRIHRRQSSTGQPRTPAMARSLADGLTATASSASSNIGRSEAAVE